MASQACGTIRDGKQARFDCALESRIMRIAHHAALGAMVALPLAGRSPWGAAILFLSSVLIDIDHLVFYAFHERRLSFSDLKFLSAFSNWSYYGPRIMSFHNYETALLLGVCAWIVGGLFVFLFVGVLIHLVLDQMDGYVTFRHFRIKSIVGDIFRYREYMHALEQGKEKEFMVARRDSWWNHLRAHVPAESRLAASREKCGILSLYSDIPVNSLQDFGEWRRIF